MGGGRKQFQVLVDPDALVTEHDLLDNAILINVRGERTGPTALDTAEEPVEPDAPDVTIPAPPQLGHEVFLPEIRKQ